MTHGDATMKHQLIALAAAGLILAQMNSYNGGIPITPGTSVPERNPAVDTPRPSRAPSSPSVPAASSPTGSGASTAPAGPGYSFGAAPPPIVSPGH
jgi:hypothetical protein